MSYIYIFVVLLFIHCVSCNNDVGDVCQSKYKEEGVCMRITDCQDALDGLKSNPRKTPTICSYQRNNLIVCCPSSSLRVLKRVEKCQEYAEYAFENVIIPAFRPGSLPLVRRKNRCGRDGAPFIVGGKDALSREFPHSALLGYRAKNRISWECGGSLVSSRYVVTAGHCLNSPTNGPVSKIRLGELVYNSLDDDARPEDFDIAQITPHPEYKVSRKYNDIALLKLSRQAKLSPYIRPICLPTENMEYDEYIASGWGYTSSYGEGSASLMKVKLESFPYEECKNSYDHVRVRALRDGLQPTQICAGHHTEMRDTCNGDSGGPLEIYHPDVACSSILIGITSFGVDCAWINFPGVYTRVSQYGDWIESIIWAVGEDF